ncbi:glycosyltransferase family 1 protein [Nitrosospira lacus]|uniref:Glycosyl transferase family 1 n=1 Tax=Nitrosospira lacus TaxID=1288494 RepID=A0A1W6SPW0_9PROT|nr:glycosyltransferase family 4 protein [Nitrosospira lacus]ARO87854.1 glycosyltransferase family 1 protein [Nitrosospira lacus]
MRVCFISHSAERYGAELALLELLKGLVELGVECKVLVPERGPLLAALDQLHIEWRIINYPRWASGSRRRKISRRITRILGTLFWTIPMARAIVKWRCDIIYTNTVIIGAGALAAWLAHRPHIWHLHESGYCLERLFDLGEHAPRLINHLSARVIVISHAVENEYARYIHPRKLCVIYQSVTLSGINQNLPAQIENKRRFRCTIVGSLQASKGQDEAIIALAELVHRGVDAELLIVGTGDNRFRDSLGQQIKFLCLEERVIFYGYAKNPLPLIHASDVILMCSRFEAFGRVTVETMLAGKPIIGTSSGGTRELIEDGKTGLLYKPGDHNELANKIQYLYENPEKRATLGAAALSWAERRFSRERYAKEVLDLLDGVWTRPSR